MDAREEDPSENRCVRLIKVAYVHTILKSIPLFQSYRLNQIVFCSADGKLSGALLADFLSYVSEALWIKEKGEFPFNGKYILQSWFIKKSTKTLGNIAC